jgi:hypothetical protein
MSNPQRSIAAALTLFFLAPLVAEYLLGDFSIAYLPLLLMLAPMYGGGALLIRELTRRAGRGWPTMLLLGCAYCLIEEGFATQSLFNRNYLGLHLLDHAWIPSLGISGWWTLFMLNVHPFWSMGVSIALTEGLFPARLRRPWLGKVGLSIAGVLFLAGNLINAAISYRQGHFLASPMQFGVTALFCLLFIAAAFLVPAPAPRPNADTMLSPWITGAAAFVLGAAVFFAPVHSNWFAVAWILAADLIFLLLLWVFVHQGAWTPLHTLSAGAGGAVFYGVHAFLQGPVLPSPRWVVLAGHVVFLLAAVFLITIAARRTQRTLADASQPETVAGR